MVYTVVALYRFVLVKNPPALQAFLRDAFAPLDLCGTLLIAPEGINGTLAGPADDIEATLAILADVAGLPKDEVKFSHAELKPFNRLKIRLKKEILTFNQPTATPFTLAGTHVSPGDWNELVTRSDVIVLDTRNAYETAIGKFEFALDPGLERFTDFAAYVRDSLDPAHQKKIAMYCTGGIRCEKAAAFMRAQGFAEVYHLKGGILKYLEAIPLGQSKWRGECYVFDRRMAVGHGLTTGRFSMCFCCGCALSLDDTAHALYEDGVSCASCHPRTRAEDKARYRARHKQMTQRTGAKATQDDARYA
jgi:UPF0176 protein